MKRFGRFLFEAYVVLPVQLLILICYDIPCSVWATARKLLKKAASLYRF